MTQARVSTSSADSTWSAHSLYVARAAQPSRDVDVRTDIWALGAVLFELLAGRPPFTGGNIPQLVHAVVNEQHASVEAMSLGLPRGIDAVISRALQKLRDARYSTIADFASDLAPFAPRHALISISRVSRLLSSQDRRVALGTDDTAIDGRSSRASSDQGTPMAWSGAKKEAAKGASKRWIGAGRDRAVAGLGIALALGWRAAATRRHQGAEGEPHIAKPAPLENESNEAKAAALPAPLAPREPLPEPVEIKPEPVEMKPEPSDRVRARREQRTSRESAIDPASAAALSAPPPAIPSAPPAPKPSGISDFGGRR